MSYCRFSSDGFRSNVYAYENMMGEFIIYVASYRKDMSNAPRPVEEEYDDLTPQEIIDRHNTIMEYYDDKPLVAINGPFDGDMIVCEDLESMYDQLKDIRECGYHVPDSAFEIIEDEMEDEGK